MTDETPLSVSRYDIDRWMVQSEIPGHDPYLVAFDDPLFPRGLCDCIDFRVRIEHPIRNDIEPEKWICKHIRAVRSELDHVRTLCEAAQIPFSQNIIPLHGNPA
jgi:hypothetical protein